MAKGALHLDRRAREIEAAAAGRDDDELLTTPQLADWLGVSKQTCEIARGKGTGAPFIRVSPTRIRYRVGSVREWLRSRTFKSTQDYPVVEQPAKGKPERRMLFNVEEE